jgi:beta-galactosidase/beta-glucuronidase
MKERFVRLITAEGERLGGLPHGDYPRPSLRREGGNSKYMILNGKWRFRSRYNDCEIMVPFCPESLLSGVKEKVIYGEKLSWERSFTLADIPADSRVLLHFGAVSGESEVFVNGIGVAKNSNGYLPFSADITDAVKDGVNTLRVEVVHDLSPRHPHGKQRKKRGGMWYTPVSGIWQTVWLETVPQRYIAEVTVNADDTAAEITVHICDAVTGQTNGQNTDRSSSAQAGAEHGTQLITAVCEGREYVFTDGKVRIEPENRELWSPENPRLYDVTIKCGEDKVRTYFALRKLEIKEVNGKKRLCLNGEPYFFNAVLDQGYFSDGLYTPADPSLYGQDIMRMKALGFNTLRKHIKIEPERFYYDCDRLGMIVFQDMVNNGYYSFIRDTALPTVNLRRRPALANARPAVKNEFLDAMEKTVRLLKNHPSICCWTIFNEGWGQTDADGAYRKLKKLDPTRFIDATSGWFKEHESDVESLHIYFKPLKLGSDRTRPQVISEFGGFVHKCPDNSFNREKTYGYGIYESREEFAKIVRKKFEDEVIPLAKEGLCASVYTQVSDVEDETNGLLTFDRRVCKLLPEDMEGVAGALRAAVRL